MKDRRARILELADDYDGIFTVAHDAIVTHGVSAQAYADIFKYLSCDCRRSGTQLIYVPAKKSWRCGTKPVTDINVLQALSQVCEIVREYLLLSWEECVFSAWLPNRELQAVEEAMDSMESFDKLKEILDLAAPNMKIKASEPEPKPKQGAKGATIDWEELGDGE